jgi:hypothetical protein
MGQALRDGGGREAITYGGPLPEDLAAHMETIIAAAGGSNA